MTILLLPAPAVALAQVDTLSACCWGQPPICEMTTGQGCDTLGGLWYGSSCVTCDLLPCSEMNVGACCRADGSCHFVWQWVCLCDMEGEFIPGSACEDVTCHVNTTRDVTWGKLKTLYR